MKILVVVAVVTVVVALAVLLRRDESTSRTPPAGPDARIASTDPATAPRTGSLLPAFPVRERETGFFGTWKEGAVEGVRVAFQEGGGTVMLYAGEFDADAEQLTELYLGAVGPAQPLPPAGSEQRIDRFLDADGEALGSRYFLWASGPTDYPQLRVAGVRDALHELSDSVLEVGLFESGGLQLQIDATRASATSVERDARHAVALVQALRDSRVAQ